MLLSDFDYQLPKELIAQEGLKERDSSRLMVLEKDGSIFHKVFRDLLHILKPGDLLVLNDARVSKARLIARKETGGKIDCLVLPQNAQGSVREVLLRPSNVKIGTRLLFFKNKDEDVRIAKVLERLGGSKFKLEFEDPKMCDELGILPVPPYIKKPLENQERYQTVFSKRIGSLAAPTAGLHFTPEFLEKLKSQGIETATVTLNIGIGTFAPIHTEMVEEWKMHPEYYEVSEDAANKINTAIEQKRRIFAVGTTSVRTLESVTRNERVRPGNGWTDIFIYPGYPFKFPYAGLLTNFHLPKSTLILLVCAFAGKEKIFAAYQEAIQNKYRFYSLGDAMLILQ